MVLVAWGRSLVMSSGTVTLVDSKLFSVAEWDSEVCCSLVSHTRQSITPYRHFLRAFRPNDCKDSSFVITAISGEISPEVQTSYMFSYTLNEVYLFSI